MEQSSSGRYARLALRKPAKPSKERAMSGDREVNSVKEDAADVGVLARAEAVTFESGWFESVRFNGTLLAQRNREGLYVYNRYKTGTGRRFDGFTVQETAALAMFLLGQLRLSGYLGIPTAVQNSLSDEIRFEYKSQEALKEIEKELRYVAELAGEEDMSKPPF